MDVSGHDTSDERLVVVGGGQAAAQLIEVARQYRFAGPITLVSDEPLLPYQRPPLSKQYLTGKYEADWLLYRPENFYPRHGVDLVLGQRAVAIDRAAGRVVLGDGRAIPYDRCALTTGTRARKLDVPGADLPNLFSIRTLDDVNGLRARLAQSRSVVIIGAGFIGLETAAVLVQQGIEVTLLAAADRILPRLVAGEMAQFLYDHHIARGVHIVTRAAVSEIEPERDGALSAILTDGRSFRGDMILVGIGAVPNTELAQAAGLTCSDGVMVDEFARTSDPLIVAAGDCTNHPNALIGRRLRLETVHNAVEQGRTAGATVAGAELPYIQQPWVWSDQYGLRLQSVGVSDGYDRTVLRGDPQQAKFSLFYYRGERMLAVNCINQPLVFGAVRRILNEGIAVSPEQAADPAFDLAALPPPTSTLTFDVPWSTRAEKLAPALAWGFS